MEFLKQYLNEELYKQVEEKLKDKVELVDLKSNNYINKEDFESEKKKIEKTLKVDYENKLKDMEWTSNTKLELVGKVHDLELVTGLLDKEKPIKEQLKDLQKSKSFLFVQEESKLSGITPADGIKQTESKSQSLGEKLGKQYQTESKNPYFKGE